jgi:hypothetical protein
VDRLQKLGALGGAAFTVLVLAALAVPGATPVPHSTTVVEYYSAHGAANLWKTALIGLALVCFVSFAGTFTRWMSSGSTAQISAGAMAALYLAAFGCFASLSRTYAGVDITTVPSDAYRDAHTLYDAGVGLTLVANFMSAAFVGATSVALITAAVPLRRLGGIGIGLTFVHLINAPLQIITSSDWADLVGAVVFITLLVWVCGLSVVLVVSMRRHPTWRRDGGNGRESPKDGIALASSGE